MRLVKSPTLAPPEIKAISKGEQLRNPVERHVVQVPLGPPDLASSCHKGFTSRCVVFKLGHGNS